MKKLPGGSGETRLQPWVNTHGVRMNIIFLRQMIR